MKRFPKAALVTANILMLVALAYSNERIVGPLQAAFENVKALISPQEGNALEAAEDGLL